MAHQSQDETHDGAVSPNGSDVHSEAAPKITLRSSSARDASRGAARVKKPPFGTPSRSTTQTLPDLSEALDVGMDADPDAPQENALERWWRESGKVVASGIVISAVWSLAFSIYITAAIGWSQLYTLLPDQFGSFMATFVLPLAFLWLVIAYLDRGQELRRESATLRRHLAQLTYPSVRGEARVSAISESLKAQARMLVDASEAAVKNMQKLQTGFLRDTEKLASVTGQLESGAASAAAAVTEQVGKLQLVIDSAADVNLKIEDALRRQHEFVRTSSQKNIGRGQ